MMEWISVDERLPEVDQPIKFLTREVGNPIFRGTFNGRSFLDEYEAWVLRPELVLVWQPLPDPPETGQNQAEGGV
jgi:hypothetical protein